MRNVPVSYTPCLFICFAIGVCTSIANRSLGYGKRYVTDEVSVRTVMEDPYYEIKHVLHIKESSMAKMTCRKGFTLIELLVVVCVIGLLAAILTPTFTMARDSAMTAYCKSKLGHLGQAYSTYLDDNNGRFQKGYCLDNCTNDSVVSKKDVWFGALENYYDDKSYLLCPQAELTELEGGHYPDMAWQIRNSGKFRELVDNDLDKGSYCLNWWVNSNSGNNVNCRYKWEMIPSENCSNIPVLADGGDFTAAVRSDYSHIPYKNPIDSSLTERDFKNNCFGINKFLMKRHGGGVNVLFMDWSVRTITLMDLYSLNWHKEYKPVSQCDATWQWPDWIDD